MVLVVPAPHAFLQVSMPPANPAKGNGDVPQLGKRASTVEDLLKSSRKGFEKVNGATGPSDDQNEEEYLFSVKVREGERRHSSKNP